MSVLANSVIKQHQTPQLSPQQAREISTACKLLRGLMLQICKSPCQCSTLQRLASIHRHYSLNDIQSYTKMILPEPLAGPLNDSITRFTSFERYYCTTPSEPHNVFAYKNLAADVYHEASILFITEHQETSVSNICLLYLARKLEESLISAEIDPRDLARVFLIPYAKLNGSRSYTDQTETAALALRSQILRIAALLFTKQDILFAYQQTVIAQINEFSDCLRASDKIIMQNLEKTLPAFGADDLDEIAERILLPRG